MIELCGLWFLDQASRELLCLLDVPLIGSALVYASEQLVEPVSVEAETIPFAYDFEPFIHEILFQLIVRHLVTKSAICAEHEGVLSIIPRQFINEFDEPLVELTKVVARGEADEVLVG
jgi:hypothetical protein